MSLQQLIESYVKDIEADFGIYIKHVQKNEEVNIHGEKLFQTASVMKLPVLATLYEKVHQGEINLHERLQLTEQDYVPGSGLFQEMDYGLTPTIKDLATMMIIVSDNLATDKLLKILGGVNPVQETMDRLGLKNIYIKHSIWDLLSLSVGIPVQPYSAEIFAEIIRRLIDQEIDWDSIVYQHNKESNDSSAKDMSLLLEMFAKGEFVSPTCSNEILNILFRQHYQQRIGGLLPRNTPVANKTGSLGTMFNDAGIVYLPEEKGQYVICVFSKGHTLEYDGNEPIAQISKMAYEYFLDGR
ncbi:serine hydrolase [Solibacillus sp. FSL K6-1523]|uniref:serine hydrolase n=1 Tax=Solibacillus sp. FSL K6-1523 TaxID=2921471 RepID=UPI0030FC313B